MSRKAGDGAAYMAATLAKGLDVLEALSEVEEIGLTELGRRIDISGPTLFRLLATLAASGYVQKSGSRYRLTLKSWEVGSKAVRRLKLRDLVRPRAERLAERSAESAHLAVLQGTGVVIIDKVEAVQPVRVDTYVGQRAPAHCSATGKAMLAFLPDDRVEEVIGGSLERYTERTVVDRAKIRRELAQVRTRGYATNKGEWRADVSAIAVPLLDHAETVVASLSLTMPTQRFTEDAIRKSFLPALEEAAAAISADLGRAP
ncbi:MAG: IclR family transcriptional regulator [Rhodospirillaceae bacterium]|nr:IclR family transcriptional regulator [Rhodospirillaceae bacterium]